MSNIEALNVANAPEASRPLLEAVNKKMGMVPNLLGTLAQAPAALQSYLSQSDAVGSGLFNPREREIVALAVGEANSCDYCLAAHTMIGGGVGLTSEEILAARQGTGDDASSEALATLARDIVISRGRPSEDSLAGFRSAGYTDGHVVELIALVALNTLTNYTNHIAGTEVDFPAAPALQNA